MNFAIASFLLFKRRSFVVKYYKMGNMSVKFDGNFV